MAAVSEAGTDRPMAARQTRLPWAAHATATSERAAAVADPPLRLQQQGPVG
jgi:hypothetical protein